MALTTSSQSKGFAKPVQTPAQAQLLANQQAQARAQQLNLQNQQIRDILPL